MITHPVFSIITVTYNAVNTLENTIKSVLNQDKDLFEYIIIDGGSTDGTVNRIEQYQDRISYWVSEGDDGIYDAMNKGLDKSRGTWILFLGADDRLEPNILKTVNSYLDDSLDLLFGNVLFSNGKRYQSTFNIKIMLNNTVHHQGAFYNKRLFEHFRYDTKIKVMADYELNLFIYMSKKKRRKIEFDIAECDVQGVSSEINRSLKELQMIHLKHYKPFLRFLSAQILRLKYFIHYKLYKINQ